MNVLLINDDYWHHGDVSDAGVGPLAAKGFTVHTMKDGAEFADRKLESYPVVMLVKSDNRTAADQSKWMTDENRKKLMSYVSAGGGLLVVHSGTAGYGGLEDLHTLFGGLFLAHPKALPVAYAPKVGHPIIKGVKAFTELDEHYFMDMAGEPLHVFLTGSTRHGSAPAGWTREEGSGRVCVLTPGHFTEVWLNPNFQTLLENALNWCAKKI